MLILVFGCSKEENLTGNAVNGKSVLTGIGDSKLFTGSLFQKVKDLFKKEDTGNVIQTSKQDIIYGGLPTKEYITNVEAWKDISECKLNLNKEINEIRNLFLDDKNEEWLDQLGLWEDKVLCMYSNTLLEVDKVLGNTIKQLANDVKGKNPEEQIAYKMRVRRLSNAIKKLQPHERAVLELDLQDFDLSEMASFLGVPVDTIKSRLSRARRSIADLFFD